MAVAIGVYLFGKVSMAHFNPAVTVGYFITKHITFRQFLNYFAAELIGALIGSVFVKYVIGDYANLGANAPNYNFPIMVIFGIEVAASALLMVASCFNCLGTDNRQEEARPVRNRRFDDCSFWSSNNILRPKMTCENYTLCCFMTQLFVNLLLSDINAHNNSATERMRKGV